MTKAYQSIERSLRRALAYANGDARGLILHRIDAEETDAGALRKNELSEAR